MAEKPKHSEVRESRNRDRRGAYRRPQTQAHMLSLSVQTAAGLEYPGTFHDLSIGGASAVFVINETQLVSGQLVVLTIGSLTRTNKVIARARVMFCSDAVGGRLCGFQFTEPAALTQQIDGFYGRFFNRRKAQRVGMPLDKKIPVHLFLDGTEIKTELLDLSVGGMQVRTTRSLAKAFDGANHTSLRFKLPGRDAEVQGRAAILRRTQLRDSVTLGLAFDLLQENGISKHMSGLMSWIVHRSNEISSWDNALAKAELAKRAAQKLPQQSDPGWDSDNALPRRMA